MGKAKTNTEINGSSYFRLTRTIDGKRKQFYGTSKGDAERKYREYIEKVAEDKYRSEHENDIATFEQRAKEYVENVLRISQKYATATKYQYECAYNSHIKKSTISQLVLSKMRPSDVQRFYNELDVSMQTMQRVNKFMTNFCKWAVLNNYCTDFMTAVEMPQKPNNARHGEIIIWDDDEIHAILHAMDAPTRLSERHRLAFFVYVLLYTGARISEAISLRYSDFADGLITIQRQCYMKEIKPPKYNSVRQIPIHEELQRAFAKHIEWHEWEMKKRGYKTEYVFTTSSGKLYDPVNVRRALKRFYATIGVEYKHPHAYRATFCTQLCRCGVPLEVASSLMGHKSMEVTAAHYALVRNETKREAIDKLTYNIN